MFAPAQPTRAKTNKVRQVKEPVTNEVILAHLQGRQSYGVYFLVEDKTKALAVDFDPNNIVFPVGGDSYYTDTFDACRGGSGCPRRHESTDILTYGVKGVPVVAAAAGTVPWIGSTP